MGHWGPGILSNDTSADIKDMFFDLYDKGQYLDEIRRQVEKEFKEGDKLVDNTDLWLTLAHFQWKVGHLDKDVKEKAEEIIDNGIDLQLWEELDADKSTLKKRSTALQKLRTQLNSENPKPRKRKKKSTSRTIFKKGECYAFKLKNGNYSAVVVLEDRKEDYTLNLIANTTINQKQLPTIDDIKKADLLILPADKHIDKRKFREAISVYMNVRYQKVIKDFIKIGGVEIARVYDKDYLFWSIYSPWVNLVETANIYLVDKKARPNEIKKMNELMKKRPPTKAKSQAGLIDKIKGWFSQ